MENNLMVNVLKAVYFLSTNDASYREISKAQKSKETNEIFMINLKKNFLIFFRISLGTIFLNFVIRFITTRITLYSMKVVHRKMIYRLIKAPINLFHDVVPVGQILNRLTHDIEIIQKGRGLELLACMDEEHQRHDGGVCTHKPGHL